MGKQLVGSPEALERRDMKEPARREFASLLAKGVFIVESFVLCGHYYVLCKFSLAGTAFPRIPFPVWFLATVGHRRTVRELEDGSEAAAHFML